MFYRENDLWRIILPICVAGVADFPGVVVKRAYQPSTQGDGTAPRVVLFRATSRRYGAQGKGQRWVVGDDGQGRIAAVDARKGSETRPTGTSPSGRMIKTETWRKEDTYQANALVDRTPEDEGYTAKDVLEGLSGHLQSDEAIVAFRNAGLGILRVTDVQEIPYEDDQGSYRISVNIKFTVTYTQTREKEIPVVSGTEFKIYRV